MSDRVVTCPFCNGKVSPPPNSRRFSLDETFAKHLTEMHPDDIKAIRQALFGMTIDDVLEHLGSNFRTKHRKETGDV